MTTKQASQKLNLSEACEHLSQNDPRLQQMIRQLGPPTLRLGQDPYQALVRSIVFQQISGKAASAIFGRFLKLFPNADFPSPELLAAADIGQLRLAGLSQRKAEYVMAIAEAFKEADFFGSDMEQLSDLEVSQKLTSIRGVGQWTADMFMIFTLGRPDVLPLNDQGIKNGMQVFFNLKKHPTETQMLKLTKHWRPFRSIASWYMWKIVDDGFEWETP